MKLQITFDTPDIDKCLKIAKDIEPFCDRLEIGSILIYKYGVEAIKAFKTAFPDKEILAETQIVERGKDITNLCTKAGAKWITVMAGASKRVIHNVCSATGSNHGVMLDLSDTDMIGQAAMDAKTLGVDAILFQKAEEDDHEITTTLDQWEIVRGNTKLPIFISSYFIDHETIKRIILLKPEGIVLGRIITDAEDPKKEAEFFYDLIKNN